MITIQEQLFSAMAAAASTSAKAAYQTIDYGLNPTPALPVDEGNQSFRLTLSGILGSISIACWVVLLVPQLIDQWKLKSSEGVSLLFLTAWFLGDLANLLGALWAHLLRNVVLLAVWFVFADALELSSAIYYRFLHHKSSYGRRSHPNEDVTECPVDEDEAEFTADNVPLLSNSLSTSAAPILEGNPPVAALPLRKTPNKWVHFGVPILAVCLAGFIGYIFSSNDDSNDVNDRNDDGLALGPQILGYISALLYLSARIPQIIQNYKKRSVHGLSLLFFIYSTMGNVTYAFQIILYSSDRGYILLNLSWLLGSLGTVFQDAIIFAQFYMYRERPKTHSASQILSEANDTPI
ncbi:PQ loop repeat-domain-containing protein [Lipomyces tetrasporus]|uniref:PQ loop repeat-domain-containing protein n=1 Tax=Lipomyces tetrasporus TaxID=54092 RepID=A0AAD7QQS4_9ASCO|nr:PQ loop repeat-domain-containing protein [Lipomyces tetrasporus]KAJ8099719.1 PQ loop repeat-domain-containing protein [Lipomyces tetrasporus]